MRRKLSDDLNIETVLPLSTSTISLFFYFTAGSFWLQWQSHFSTALPCGQKELGRRRTNSLLYRKWRRHHLVCEQHGEYWLLTFLMLKSSKPSILPTKLILKIRPWTLNQREEDHVCKRTPITRETRKSDVVQKLDKHVSHTFSRALSVNLRVEADERELGRTRDELTASPLEPSSFLSLKVAPIQYWDFYWVRSASHACSAH